ncbi:MAG: helicase-related protein [Acidimicrobiales bacterium]
MGIAGSDDVGEVLGSEWDGEGHTYKVRRGAEIRRFTEAGLRSIDLDEGDPAVWLTDRPGTARQVALRLTHTKLSHALSDTVYSYGATKTVYRAYQFKPVLRLISSPRKRLLIADEVGLGKTIEAGLVWTELEQRTTMTRALVVCPAMLVPKWRDEMRRRFDRDLRLLDAQGIEEMVNLFRKGDDITPMYGVVSLERLRFAPVLEALQSASPSFDLAIVDEAHYMRNPATLSHDVGELLSDWADALLFLSATPLNLGQDDLFSLLNLLLPEEFHDKRVLEEQLEPNAVLTEVARYLRTGDEPPRVLGRRLSELAGSPFGGALLQRPEARELLRMLGTDDALPPRELATARRLLSTLHPLGSAVTRTRKVDVPEDKAVRQAMPIDVAWTDEEYAFYQAVYDWTLARARARGVPAGFGMQMPLRQTASCLPAMIERLTAGDGPDSDDVIDEDEADLDRVWETADQELDSLRSRVSRLARAVTVDSKFEALRNRLVELRTAGVHQVMVFSFFRRTLDYLAARLGADWKVAVMHGGVDYAERQRIMNRFRTGDTEVLLLSEVGSEGLDFEFCSVVVNYDLPWNPMKVEQRIGRVDRFGQKAEKVFILNFHVPGTIETDILQRLYDRLGVFERSIGELEPVLRSDLGDLEQVVLDPTLTDEERSLRLREKAAAVEERAMQLQDLEQARSQLAGIDGLLVDGLRREIDRGRYIGPSELRSYVEESLRHGTGARLIGPDHEATLIGDQSLQRRLFTHLRTGAGTRYGLPELGRLLADEEPIPVTFDQTVASTEDRELMSARHPLVASATKHFTERGLLAPGRFGAVSVEPTEGVAPGTYAVVVYLLEVTGLRPTLELWPVAVDLARHDHAPGVGDALLATLARGELRDDRERMNSELASAIDAVQQLATTLQRREEQERRQSNEALVDARAAAVESEITHKIARARRTLESVSDPSIQRLHRGRIRNLEADRDRRITGLEEKRAVAASLRPVSSLQVRVRSR